MHKDLHLASISGYEVGTSLPVVNVTKEIYSLAMREGYGDLDYGSIYAFFTADRPEKSAAAVDVTPSPAGAL
jgi:3-hydroxyisobutyrate dehydrogenase-like beta-hydroxyacid dehydrogenase